MGWPRLNRAHLGSSRRWHRPIFQIVTTTLRNRTGKLADNVTRNNAPAGPPEELWKAKPFSGGRTIVQSCRTRRTGTYKRYSGYEVLNISPSDVFSAAEFPIRQSAVAGVHQRP